MPAKASNLSVLFLVLVNSEDTLEPVKEHERRNEMQGEFELDQDHVLIGSDFLSGLHGQMSVASH